jgi:meso-butanediol dehydrogenase/(S,S)-butanediol dehydrogenase/diacetyl reductase
MSKVIVITGAGVGLGRALARRFATEGESVVLLGRTASKVEDAAQDIGERAMAVACDVASPASVREAFASVAKRHPHIDVLVNNAAIFEPFQIVNASDEQILNTVATNLAGPMLCARSAIPMMGKGGHIINVSSESVDMPFPHLSVYQSSKAGLERFSASLYRELEASGIRVSNVRAGSMFEEGKAWEIDPEVGMQFYQAALAAGINLGERPLTQYTSVTGIFRALIDLPADLQVAHITLHGRATQ